MRPQFHLLPAQNWMNDPNGPIYFAGKYHMFFQYNPQAAVWGNMSWDHATSPDMLHWTHQPLAFTMSADGPDAAGCFSGSCIAVEEGARRRVYAVYTGVVRDKQHETIRNEGLRETQCLAWSDDANLLHWTKLREPIIAAVPAGLPITGFRDPAVWKRGEWYYMTVGSGVEKKGGCVLLYRSSDLRSWEYLHELASGTWNGKATSNPVADGEMWECPEFFALDAGYVLIYSTAGRVFWQSGTFDQTAMIFHPLKTGLLDLDAFYAPKTQLDGRGRRILWGWIPERRSEQAMRAAGWSGMMSLPRVMSLDRSGNLRLKILPETAGLRAGKVPVGQASGEQTILLAQACGEFSCSAASTSSFELKMSLDSGVLVDLVYHPEDHSFVVDGREIVLSPDDLPSVHGFVDGSVVELILGGRVGYTRRFYYDQSVAPHVRVGIKGATVKAEAWRISPISPNRLTTPAARELDAGLSGSRYCQARQAGE